MFAGLALIGGLLVPLGAWAAGLSLSNAAVAGLIAAQLAPWALGRWLRRVRPSVATYLGRATKRAGGPLLGAVIVSLLVTHGNAVGSLGLWPFVTSLVVVLASWALGAASKGSSAVRLGLGAVTSVRNLTLALLVATAAQAPPLTTLAVLLFGLVMFLVPAAAGALRVALRKPTR